MTTRPLACALLLGLFATAAAAERPAEIDAYRQTLAQVEAARSPVSLEPLLAAAEAAQDALMRIDDSDRAWLEIIGDDEFEALKAELRGLQLARGYDVYAQPDGAFLLQLATAKGRADDAAFFRLYDQLWSEQQLPKYLELGNRPTPCVRYGTGVLPELYQQWRDYAAQYPLAYVAHTKQTIADLEEAVALGVCACTDAADVERELSGFLKRFPTTPVAPQIALRLKELKEQPDLRPVRCR